MINIIYIVSNGRSGSTLLELLLNQNQKFETLGEAQNVYLENKIGGKCAGCGISLKDDNLWGEVLLKSNEQVIKYTSFFRKTTSQGSHNGKVLRFKYLINILFNSTQKNFIFNFNESSYNFYKTIIKSKYSKEKDIHILIDSSKDFYRLYYLLKNPKLNILPIHIYKSPYEFVYSMTKGLNRTNKFFKTIRFTIRWVVENHLIRFILRKKNHLSVSHSELCQNPGELDSFLENFYNIKLNKRITKENHGICGNKMRGTFKKIIYKPIKIQKLGYLNSFIVFLFTAQKIKTIKDV